MADVPSSWEESWTDATSDGEDITAMRTRAMSMRDITNFIDLIAQSHSCDPRDITYHYEPIITDDSAVILDELFLVFHMKTLINNIVSDRVIHTIRVTVPQEVQQRARAMRDSVGPRVDHA